MSCLFDFSALNIFSRFSVSFIPSGAKVDSVVIDDRNVKKNSLFIAIKGENHDGHDYIKSAVENGAVFIVCEHLDDYTKDFLEKKSVGYAVVHNSIEALQEMAVFQRSRLKAKVVGITGSVGKTTTREMFNSVFARFYRTVATTKNYNNNIGLPLTICNTPLDTQALILEMGMNNAREIEHLTKIARPDVAVITNVKNTHVGNFKSIDEVADAKAEIFSGLTVDGVVVLNSDDNFYKKLVNRAEEKGIKNIVGVGDKNSLVYAFNCVFENDFTTRFDVNCFGEIVRCKIEGYNIASVKNSLFVFAVAKKFGLDLKKVADALSCFKIVEGRGNLEKISTKKFHDVLIFNDCYNSSPEALTASIISLGIFKRKNPDKRVLAVIGDMLELGSLSNELHLKIADVLVENEIKNVVLIGKESIAIFDKLPDGFYKRHFATTSAFEAEIGNFVKDFNVIMLKASLGLHFEKIIEKLRSL